MSELSAIGPRIKQVRKASELSQREFMSSVGISSGSYWSKVEQGANVPSDSVLMLITKQYGIDKNWLLTGQGVMHSAVAVTDDGPEFAEKDEVGSPPNEKGGSMQFCESDIRRFVRQEVRDLLDEEFRTVNARLSETIAHLNRIGEGYRIGGWEKKTPPLLRKTADVTLEVTEMKLIIPGAPDDLDKEGRGFWNSNAKALQRWAATPEAVESFPKRSVPPWAIDRFLRETRQMYAGGSVADVSGILWDLIDEGPAKK